MHFTTRISQKGNPAAFTNAITNEYNEMDEVMFLFDMTAIGELLIDFTPLGDRSYRANPGGAPANVLVAAERLGKKTAFLGMVGTDAFGDMLEADLKSYGIDTSGLLRTDESPTTLAFIHLDEDGNRSFSFIRNPGADTLLNADLLDYQRIGLARLLHFGSVSLTHQPSREATFAAVQFARCMNIPVSYDPNLRTSLWPSLEEANEQLMNGLQLANIVKLSLDELEFLTATNDLKQGSAMILSKGPELVFVTLGAHGCVYRTAEGFGYLSTYDTSVIDTTGCGDAFFGCALSLLLDEKKPLADIPLSRIAEIADYANCAGALCATKIGSMAAMPTMTEIEHCRAETAKLIFPDLKY